MFCSSSNCRWWALISCCRNCENKFNKCSRWHYHILHLLLNKPFYSIQTISMDLSFLYIKGSQVKFLNFNIFLNLKIVLSLQTVQTQMKCRLMWHFICVFTVCGSTYFLVSRMKMVKKPFYVNCLLADDSHKIPSLISLKIQKCEIFLFALFMYEATGSSKFFLIS